MKNKLPGRILEKGILTQLNVPELCLEKTIESCLKVVLSKSLPTPRTNIANDLLISFLSFDQVSCFLLLTKTQNSSLFTGR